MTVGELRVLLLEMGTADVPDDAEVVLRTASGVQRAGRVAVDRTGGVWTLELLSAEVVSDEG